MSKLYAIIGASGSGKSTIGAEVFGKDQEVLSTTTRPMRPGEIQGVHYNFVELREFLDSLRNRWYAEHDVYNGHAYGISYRAIQDALKKGDSYVVITYDGYKQIKDRQETTAIFIDTSLEDTKRMLEDRGDENIEARLAIYEEDRKTMKHCDIVIKNEYGKLAETIETIKKITMAKTPYEYVAVDFDGTIAEEAYPGIGSINHEAKFVINKFRENGGKILIWTCREGKLLEEAKQFLDFHGVGYDTINENHPDMMAKYGNNPRKIGADLYVDDKSPFGADWLHVGHLLGVNN